MALAGFVSRTAVTTTATNPASGDLGTTVTSSALNRTAAELDDTYQGDANTSFFQGLKGAEMPVSADYDSSDPLVSRLTAAFDSGDTVYFHFLPNGTTGTRVPCKVSGVNIEGSVDGKVTFSATVKSVGAPASVTLS